MRPRTFKEPNGNITIMKAIINLKFSAARNFAVPACESFMLVRSNKRLTNTNKVKPRGEKEGALLRDKTEVGYFVSTAQFVYKIPGSLPTGYGRESRDNFFQSGTIYNDDYSSLIWVEDQVSLGSN